VHFHPGRDGSPRWLSRREIRFDGRYGLGPTGARTALQTGRTAIVFHASLNAVLTFAAAWLFGSVDELPFFPRSDTSRPFTSSHLVMLTKLAFHIQVRIARFFLYPYLAIDLSSRGAVKAASLNRLSTRSGEMR
jgi:hypothetical protein